MVELPVARTVDLQVDETGRDDIGLGRTAVAGIAVAVWVRVDDWKKGLR